jgi:Amino acid permease
MTGVEAVSNGVMAFREPTTKNAKTTLTIIIALLIILLAGIALLCRAYGIGATEPGSPGYQSVLSQLTVAVAGKGIFYYITIGSILLVLSLSANTAFADFPRLTRAIALRNYLPHVFILRGRRLLYSHGIIALVIFTGALLIFFGGVTDRLIPLYAIGAFMAFTLSQAGMVVHWYKQGNATGRMIMNGIGASATGLTLLVVLVAKFLDGAWITVILIPALILLMSMVRKHYDNTAKETANPEPLRVDRLYPPRVIIPMDKWNRISERGLRFALAMSPEVEAVHIECGDEEDSVCEKWNELVLSPIRAASLPEPRLTTIKSPYRFVIQPFVEHVLAEQKKSGDRQIAVLVPELVVRHWYENLLHNQRANLLKLILLVKGNENIVVINIPWYLHK